LPCSLDTHGIGVTYALDAHYVKVRVLAHGKNLASVADL